MTTVFILVSFLIGLVTGIIMHRSDYCIAGMFRDVFLFKNTFMLKSLVILITTNMLIFELLHKIGIIRDLPFPLLANLNFGTIAGGIIFGIGMVMAGGCVVGTLYKVGAGSIASIVALAGMIAGSIIFIEYSVFFIHIRNLFIYNPEIKMLHTILGVESWIIKLAVISILLIVIINWHKKNMLFRKSYASGYIQPVHAALGLSALSTASYYFAGMPLGITSSYTKAGSYIINLFTSKDHINSLSILSKPTLDYINPFTSEHLIGGVGIGLDGIAIVQFPVISGIILGSFISAVVLREFKVYTKIPLIQYLSSFTGGVLMGIASRIGGGCNIWHLFGGLPILALSSIVFTLFLFLGAYIGTIILKRILL